MDLKNDGPFPNSACTSVANLPSNSDELFRIKAGLPHPHWPLVHGWARGENLWDNEDFWSEFVRGWLNRLSQSLGGSYSIGESANFFLLSTLGDATRTEALNFLERSRAGILYSLSERMIQKGTTGKHLVLRFQDEHDYYRYISAEYADGESPTTGGVFFRIGYTHIATYEQLMPDSIRPILVHELTHNLTCHLPHPTWLCEALAMAFEVDIGGSSRSLGFEKGSRNTKYWGDSTIQEFWKGSAFHSVEGQGPSYHLADLLLQTIRRELQPPPEALQRFVLAADWTDAGQWAAATYLKCSLQEIATEVLGPGPWEPEPGKWEPPRSAIGEDETVGQADENGIVWPEGLEPRD